MLDRRTISFSQTFSGFGIVQIESLPQFGSNQILFVFIRKECHGKRATIPMIIFSLITRVSHVISKFH